MKHAEGLSGPAATTARLTCPQPGSSSFPIRRTVIARRLETLKRFNRLKKTHSVIKSAQIVGSSPATLWRWQKRFKAAGVDGLKPHNFKAGRRSPFAGVKISAKALRELELLHVEQIQNPNAVWRQFAKFNPACPPAVADFVQRHGRAPALLAGLGRVNLVQARCYVSADGKRLFVKLPSNGVLRSQFSIPPAFRLVKLHNARP